MLQRLRLGAVFFLTTSVVVIIVVDAASLELSLKPPGDTFNRAIGTSMVLTCEVNGTGQQSTAAVTLQWKDRAGLVVSDNSREKRIYVEKHALSQKLYVTNIENKDAGNYTCQLMAAGKKLSERSVRLTIFKDITFDNAPSPQNPAINSNATIHCRVSGEPKPDVYWRFKNGKIEPDARYKIDASGLYIRNITQADNGEYTCSAEVQSTGLYDERRITVAVHIPPRITIGFIHQIGVEGAPMVMQCRGSGLPAPKYEFRKNNHKWIPTEYGRITVDSDTGRIEFKPLRKADEGEYTCAAINDVGEDKSTATIKVNVPPNIHELKNLSKAEGESATLICLSHGDPHPSMTFRKIGNSHDYNRSMENGRITVTPTVGRLELHIKRLRATDSGNYTCTSHNQAGRDTAVGSIVVNFKPVFRGDHNRMVYLWAGKTHNISCHAHGHPPPEISWLRRDRELQNNDTYQIFTNSGHSNLQVRVKEADQSWIYGKYTCRAKNRLGMENHDIEITRAKTPPAPLHVQVQDYSPNMLVLAVKPPKDNGGKEIIGYRVEYGKKLMDFSSGYAATRADTQSNTPHYNTSKVSDDLLVIENLKPSTKYVFLIRAKNEVGVGHAIECTATTAPISKPYPIRIISPKNGVKAHEYTLVWDTPKTGGKPIDKYIIKYRQLDPKGQSDRVEKTVVDNPRTPIVKYTLGGLTPVTQYEVEIIAHNSLGDSLPSKFVFNTSQVPPTKSGVGSGVGPTHCRASWTGVIMVGIFAIGFSVGMWTSSH